MFHCTVATLNTNTTVLLSVILELNLTYTVLSCVTTILNCDTMVLSVTPQYSVTLVVYYRDSTMFHYDVTP